MPVRLITAALLVASLSANVFLLTRTEAPGRPSPSDANYASATTSADLPPPTSSSTSTVAPPNPTPSSDSTSSTWEQFATRDPSVLAQRLRAAGFPPHASRAAVLALMLELHSARMTDALKSLPADPYWKVGGSAGGWMPQNREYTLAWAERSREASGLFPEVRVEEIAQLRARFGPLPEDKLDQLAMLERDYAALRAEVMMRQNDIMTPRMPWTNDALRLIDEELQKDRAALLTPAELEDFNFRNSRTARTLDRPMAIFSPTEAEFREIYRLRAAFDEQFAFTNAPSQRTAFARREAQQAMDQSLRATLGESRYAEYQRANDPGFQAAYLVAERHGLSTDRAVSAHAIQRETEQKLAKLRSNRTQSSQERTAALAALMNEAQSRLTQALTEEGWSEYRSQASWWRSLERQANPPSTPRP